MAHIRKRQFQPSNQSSIKSFFSSVGTTSSSSSSSPAADVDEYTPPLRPVLPDHVQSLLINVGMRVRKSVPEGYKTHKSLPVPTMSYMHPGSISANTENELPSSSAPDLYTKPSELAPFCGLHKTGGFSSQPTSSYPSSTPGLSSSQSTVASCINTPQTPQTRTRKRSYADEMDDDLDKVFSQDDEAEQMEDAVSSKLGYPLSHSSMSKLGAQTSIVQPQNRPKVRMKARSPKKIGSDGKWQFDFADEDVDFLQPMDCE
jgi:hypothetical protein